MRHSRMLSPLPSSIVMPRIAASKPHFCIRRVGSVYIHLYIASLISPGSRRRERWALLWERIFLDMEMP